MGRLDFSISEFQVFSFAFYQAGNRPQGTINLLLLHALINFVVGSVLWYFVGYSLSFGISQKVGSQSSLYIYDRSVKLDMNLQQVELSLPFDNYIFRL